MPIDPTQIQAAATDVTTAAGTLRALVLPYWSMIPADAAAKIDAAFAELDDATKRLADALALP